MPRTKTITTYQFEELSDKAKEKARQWFREGSHSDFDGTDLYEDFETAAKLIGIEFDTYTRARQDGTPVYKPKIHWSGFCSQGDGASFEGTYSFQPGGAAAIRKEWPQDTTLHNIADRLAAVQRRHLYGLKASVERVSSPYYHENTVEIDVRDARDEDKEVSETDTEIVEDALRDFMRWMYRILEAEWDYTESDEYIDEALIANEYEFDEEGEIA